MGMHVDDIVSNLLTIEEIVKDRLFKIPDYQRGYSWEESQLIDLIKDIDHIATINHRHYTGTIVITKNADDRKYEVVDGQQRLTTLIILFRLIYSIDPIKYASIKETFILRNDTDYVLEPNLETNNYFQEAILGDKKNLQDDIKSLTNLKNAKIFLLDWLNRNIDRLDDIYNAVSNRLGFICFSPADTNEVGIMFEVINNRGKALSELEKIKNYFIYYATIKSKIRLRDKINANWGRILQYLSKAYITSNDEENSYLRNCYIVFYSANKSKSWYVYDELKEKYKPEDNEDIDGKIKEIEAFIDFIHQAAQTYAYLFNGEFFNADYKLELKKELAYELKKIRCHHVKASILPLCIASMSYLGVRTVDVIELLKLIEILNFRIYVLPNTKIARADSKQGDLFAWARYLYRDREWDTTKDDKPYFTLKNREIKGDIFAYTTMMLEDFTSVMCPEETFIQSLTIDNDEAIDYYYWDGLRFFLASYEEELNKGRRETWDIERIRVTRDDFTKEKGNDYLSKEHIWARNNRVTDFPEDIKEKRRLGNFVLLGLTSNIQLQDDDIEIKVVDLVKKSDDSPISMIQVHQLSKYLKDAIGVVNSKRHNKTKKYFHDLAISLIDKREMDLINFALKRWKLSTEEFVRFDKIDTFEADEKKMNSSFFLKE